MVNRSSRVDVGHESRVAKFSVLVTSHSFCMFLLVYVLCVSTYMYTYVYVCICTYMYVYVCICTYMYVYVCICMYMYVCVRIIHVLMTSGQI